MATTENKSGWYYTVSCPHCGLPNTKFSETAEVKGDLGKCYNCSKNLCDVPVEEPKMPWSYNALLVLSHLIIASGIVIVLVDTDGILIIGLGGILLAIMSIWKMIAHFIAFSRSHLRKLTENAIRQGAVVVPREDK